MNKLKEWRKDGFVLRPAKIEDAQEYYEHNFNPLDREIVRLTGSRSDFSRNEVINHFKNCIHSKDRYDFVLVSIDGHIIGESVLNEIDEDLRSANFRICIFHRDDCNKGIGSWMIEKTLEFAFEDIKLHRVELDVYSFNQRAIYAYEKAGFKHEGVLRDAVKDGETYADVILMAILENEWIKTKD